MNFEVELEQETDGRWIAEIPEIPGALAYGVTPLQAGARVRALALRVLAERMESALTQNVMRTSNKTKGLADISVGQRPTKGEERRFKAVSLADNGVGRTSKSVMFRKAYSLEVIVNLIRRALPYANIHKAFSLQGSRGGSPSICLHATAADVDAQWIETAKRRFAELQAKTVKPVPGVEVFARILDRYSA